MARYYREFGIYGKLEKITLKIDAISEEGVIVFDFQNGFMNSKAVEENLPKTDANFLKQIEQYLLNNIQVVCKDLTWDDED